VLAVASVIYLAASAVFGRGEQLDPLPPGATPTRLPASEVASADIRALRFQQVFRGYKAAEVDWALERLAGEVDDLRGRIAVLERQLDLVGDELDRSQREPEANRQDQGPSEGEPGAVEHHSTAGQGGDEED
jgi:DivIVA domain-containing protein